MTDQPAYYPPEPRLWPGNLPRPSCDQIAEAVAVSMRIKGGKTFMDGRRVIAHVIARRMFGLIASRIRGMSTPEIAGFLNVAAHSAFTNNGDWACEFCRSSCGTAAYNEIVKALELEVGRDYQPGACYEAARIALAKRGGRYA